MSWESLKTKQDKNPDSEIDILFATLFNLPNGNKVIDYLERITIKANVSPQTPSSNLWHLEGQRYLVNLIKNKIRKGSKNNE